MFGIRTSISSALFFVSTGLLTAAPNPDYFPLQVGNQWVFRASGRVPGTEVVDVYRKTTIADKEYYGVRFFGREVLLRMADDGALYSIEGPGAEEKLWVPFGAEEGSSFNTAIDTCTSSGSIQSKSLTHNGPSGEFGQAIAIAFQPSCSDAGLESMVFVPNAGPVEFSQGNIAGSRKFELIYSRAGATVLSAPETGFAVTLDAPVYAFAPPATAGGPQQLAMVRMTLRNTAEPVELTFPSGQTYDIVVKDASGTIVWRWSDGRGFTLAIRRLQFAGGERNWAENVPLNGLPAGKYTMEAFLTTVEPRQYVASVGFEIRVLF